ncbi:Huwe1, partial [Columba livia]
EAACRKEEEERRARERQEEEEAKCLEKFEGAEPLEASELLAFTDSMLPGCSQLLDELPDTVYRVCDLIMTAVKRNGAAYRDSVLRQVWDAADVLIKAALPLTTSDTKTVSEWISQMATLPQASNLATRILLLTLLFEELKLPCARVVESSCVLDVLIKLLEGGSALSPGCQRAQGGADPQYLQFGGNTWRWFDDRSGRWCSYSASNNSTIDARLARGRAQRALHRRPPPLHRPVHHHGAACWGVPVDPDTLHAALRLCLRLTRQHQHALLLAELRSTRTILGLSQSSAFTGFLPLLTLLFRHIIEEPCTLRHTMEKVVRSAATSGAGSTTSGVVSGSLGSREINYILRVLGPAACRSPQLFTEVATACVRIALPAPRGSGTASDEEFENLRIKGPNAVQLVKTTPVKPSPLPPIPDPIKDVIYDMLNALAAYHAPPDEGGSPGEGRKEKDGERGDERPRAKATRPLLPTSSILRLLAELVRSYVGIASLIANYSYSVGQSELIKEDCSVLAFVLDHLLPHTGTSEDKDTPALARLFLASLAAAGSGTDAQVALVNEVKAALGPRSGHGREHREARQVSSMGCDTSVCPTARLQAVMCIISTIMESCPSTSSFYSSATKPQHNGMNNIIRLFLKKGLVNDLARVPHSLDLSSPNMANTVNAALKPLETLSRIVNQPSGLFGSKGSSSKSKTEGAGGGPRGGQRAPRWRGPRGPPNPPEEDAEAAQAEAADGDMDGEAEGDTVVLAGQPEGLSTQEMQVENELEDLIDELLERDGASGNSTIIVSRSGEDESQEDVLMDEAPSNLSQASTLQANREGTLSSIPTALTRWTEECKVLDAESMHDCVSVVKVPILARLEALRDEELDERREKRRRQAAEDEAKATSAEDKDTVLAQQRAEQQRRELAQATGSDAPLDPVTFIQTLPSELRRSVLEDMEDSVLAVMPPDIAAEAQALRREQEARQRQLMHERLFGPPQHLRALRHPAQPR